MPGLREALADLADEARPYGDPAAAVGERARRRRRRVFGPAAMVAVLILSAAAIWGPRLMPINQAGGRPTPPASPPCRSGFPVPLPSGAAAGAGRPLPADRGIGAAWLVRVREARTATGSTSLPTGQQYQIELPDASPRFTSVTLSPNGRFLLWTTPDGTVLRDFSGTGQIRVPVHGWRMWAPDSGALRAWTAGAGGCSTRTPVICVRCLRRMGLSCWPTGGGLAGAVRSIPNSASSWSGIRRVPRLDSSSWTPRRCWPTARGARHERDRCTSLSVEAEWPS